MAAEDGPSSARNAQPGQEPSPVLDAIQREHCRYHLHRLDKERSWEEQVELLARAVDTAHNRSQASVVAQVAMTKPPARGRPYSSSLSPIHEDTADGNRGSMADKLCRPLLDTRAKEYLGRGQLAVHHADVLSQHNTEYQDRELEGPKATATEEPMTKRNPAMCEPRMTHQYRNVGGYANPGVRRSV